MRRIDAEANLGEQMGKLLGESELLLGGQNCTHWLTTMQTLCMLRGKGAWDFITGDAQRTLSVRLLKTRLTQDEYDDKLLAENALALGHIRAGAHGDLEHLIMTAVTLPQAMEILKSIVKRSCQGCTQSLLRGFIESR